MDNLTENNNSMFQIGKRLRECRVSKGLSQEQLAEAVEALPDNRGKTRSAKHISYLENGTRAMSAEYAGLLAQVLNVRTEYLLLKDDNKTNAAIFAKAITKKCHEGDTLMVGLSVFAELAGYQIEFNMPHSGKISADKALESIKTAYTLSHDGAVIRLSVDEMNAFENEVFDSVELQLKHLFKRKGVVGNG